MHDEYIGSSSMKTASSDTIVAIATPVGVGGISVIRVSGLEALPITSRLFRGTMELQTVPSHTAHFGRVLDWDGNPIDEVVATVFRGPTSYTGEDIVELSCHGGILVTKRILQTVIQQGARHAEAGEFTKRAFLNGRMDLSQAEAVADLIHAQSSKAHEASIRQLEGDLSERIHALTSKLVDSIALLELELDFAEENLEFINKQEFRTTVEGARREVQTLMGTFKLGRIYREGVKVAIVGPPNAGKSSLLNSLLESNRAIVSDIPGTTRDTIEEAVNVEGFSFRLVDTAGLRRTDDLVEKEGIKRTENEAKSSDIVLAVLDASQSADRSHDDIVGEFIKDFLGSKNACIIALNKSDLGCRPTRQILKDIELTDSVDCVRISAKTRDGIDKLQRALVERAVCGNLDSGDSGTTVTSVRHFDVLQRAEKGLGLSLQSLAEGKSNEFVAVDLRGALDCLGEITGEVTTDEILDHIFSKFCIGK